MKISHIYWFGYYNMSEPGIRYRGKYALDELKRNHNISYSLVTTGYTPGIILNFIRVYCSALLFRKKNSIIVFQKIRTNRLYATSLKALLLLRKQRTLYDMDDPDYLKFNKRTINFFIKHSETCSMGSAALMDYAQKTNANSFLLTSPVISHTEIKKQVNKIFTVGWVGYYNAHKESLQQLLYPALINLTFNVKLVLLGVTSEEEKNEIRSLFSEHSNISLDIPLVLDWMDELSIYRRIKEFDVGISPLLDTEVNRAKSAFKLKQCLSCGVPVLASPVGENLRFIENGINGFLCDSANEFEENICKIKSLDTLNYQQMSTSAWQSVKNFSMLKYSEEIIGMYK